MKRLLPVIAVLALGCISCVKVNPELGKNLLPLYDSGVLRYSIAPIEGISMKNADSLSGFSSTKMVLGSLRDETFGRVDRSCVVNMVPLFVGESINLRTFLDSTDIRVKSFHFCVGVDTTSWAAGDQAPILQNVRVNPLTSPVNPKTDFDCNDVAGALKVDRSVSVVKGTPVVNGRDSLSFDFTEEYAMQYLRGIDDVTTTDFGKYNKLFPGICISVDPVSGNGGRINIFKLQLGFSQDSGITGNLAEMVLSYTAHRSEGGRPLAEPKDTTLLFWLGVDDFHDVDSLFTNSGTGSFPQHALNVSSHQSRPRAGTVQGDILLEGGGGLKPVIPAAALREKALEIIADSARAYYGREATAEEIASVIINKATLEFPFEFTESMYDDMYQFPARLSPYCRIHYKDSCTVDGAKKYFTSVRFGNLTDYSDENENQGDIDRHNLTYSPDITYHMNEIRSIKEGTEYYSKLLAGDYDIWLLPMASESVTTTSASNSDMNEYYQYLAYQNYYNSMYGGYGGYGYGGYGYGDSYSNYYSYMMASMYAGASSTSTTTTLSLDTGRYYRAVLNGPGASRAPALKLFFTIPNTEE